MFCNVSQCGQIRKHFLTNISSKILENIFYIWETLSSNESWSIVYICTTVLKQCFNMPNRENNVSRAENLVTSLTLSTRLSQVVNSLFKLVDNNKTCEHNMLTACLQTCCKLWDFYVCNRENNVSRAENTWKHVGKPRNIVSATKMFLNLLGNIFACREAIFVFATMFHVVGKQGNIDRKHDVSAKMFPT